MINIIKFLSLILFMSASTSFACSFDTDCSPGSKCIKRSYELKGVCVGGINPGNTYDRNPGNWAPDPKYGNTCSFDTDCTPGKKCMKSSGSIRGTCM